MQCDHFEHIVTSYYHLAQKIDDWFLRCCSSLPDIIACKRGCSGCCRGLFDITILDASLLRRGVMELNPAVRDTLELKARIRLDSLVTLLPTLSSPWFLNHLNDDYVAQQFASDDEPCIFLNNEGECLVYAFRPLTCRLHGIPAYDEDGECYSDEHCSLNCIGVDLPHPHLARANFPAFFREEQRLLGAITNELFGFPVSRCDTLIPASVCIDYREMILANVSSD